MSDREGHEEREDRDDSADRDRVEREERADHEGREDFDLDPAGLGEARLEGEVYEPRRNRGVLWVVLLIAAAAIAGLVYWWQREPEQPEPPTVTEPAREAAPEPAAAPESEEVGAPPLTDSDAWIRTVAEQLSSHPRLATWLAHEDLVRRFVAAVDNFADGVSPRNHVAFAGPSDPFQVVGVGDEREPAPSSYDRYSPIVAAIDSLHVGGTADLYRRLEPLFDEAYADLGYPDRRFRETLERAMRRVVEAPVLDGPPAVVETPSGYRFADPELESLDDATKHLIRLGPDNLAILKRKVRRLAETIGLDLSA